MNTSLRDIGILGEATHFRLYGGLEYEPPINLTMDNEWNGECSVGAFSYVRNFGVFSDTSIGRYCSLAPWVLTGPGRHNPQLFSTHPFVYDPEDQAAHLSSFDAYKRILGSVPPIQVPPANHVSSSKVLIGNDVWVGTRAIIMAGVTVGHGAIIGAGAVVTRDIPPYAIAVGVPAKVIRYRFESEIVKQLCALAWWEYDMGAVSNRVNYGDPAAVIDFMQKGIADGTIQKFQPQRLYLKKTGNSYDFEIRPPASS